MPHEGMRCLVHLQDPDNAITLFPAAWDQQQVAFVADVFLGMVGGNNIWATIDVRFLPDVQSSSSLRTSPVLQAAALQIPETVLDKARLHPLLHSRNQKNKTRLLAQAETASQAARARALRSFICLCVTTRQHVLQGVRVGGSESHELVNVEPTASSFRHRTCPALASRSAWRASKLKCS